MQALDAILSIGSYLYLLSFLIAIVLKLLYLKHPNLQIKLQIIFERHIKVAGIVLIVYMFWASLGAVWVITLRYH